MLGSGPRGDVSPIWQSQVVDRARSIFILLAIKDHQRIKAMRVEILGRTGHKLKKLNRRKAIRERCLICSDWSPKEVKKCKFSDCPLIQFRTGKGHQNATDRSMVIRDYCKWCAIDQASEVRLCPSTDCPLWSYRKTKIDKAAEIKPGLSKNDHIRDNTDHEIEAEYHSKG
jgi:hypothetical protein